VYMNMGKPLHLWVVYKLEHGLQWIVRVVTSLLHAATFVKRTVSVGEDAVNS